MRGPLALIEDVAARQHGGDGLVHLDGDGDLDHATPRLIGTTLSSIWPRARACSNDRAISSCLSGRPRLRSSAATISCFSVVMRQDLQQALKSSGQGAS